MNNLARLCQFLGLHPLVGFGMFAVDWMMFGATATSGGVAWIVTMPVAVMLSVPCILIQRHMFKDGWGAAVGKGLMVGVLTGVPSPLPSIVPFTSGTFGAARALLEVQNRK